MVLDGSDRAGADRTVIACAELLDPERQRDITWRAVPDDRPSRDRILRSWLWIGYAELVLPSLFVSWLLGEGVPDLSASNTVAVLEPDGFRDVGAFSSVSPTTPARAVATGDDRDDLDAALRGAIDHHVGPLLRGASVLSRVGLRTIWGSVASVIATWSPMLATERGAEIDPDALGAAMARRSELTGLGEFVCVEHDGSRRVGFHRSTCCLWFRLDPGQMCEGCVMAPRDRLVASLRAGHGKEVG